MKKQPIEPTVKEEELTVKYWRGRFPAVFGRFKNLVQVAEELAEIDSEFAGISGYKRLENIKRDKAGLQLTAKAVRLMEQLRPEVHHPPSRLARQKLASVS
ncbi:hypothetical protein [Spirosoma areae]